MWLQGLRAGEGTRLIPPSQREILDSIAHSGSQFQVDGLAADQVLVDLRAESTSALPDSWVTNMASSTLIPQLQSMLRSAALQASTMLVSFEDYNALTLKRGLTGQVADRILSPGSA